LSTKRSGSFYLQTNKPIAIVQEVRLAPETVWKGTGNLAPTGIRSPGRTAHNESPYRLRYPGPHLQTIVNVHIVNNRVHASQKTLLVRFIKGGRLMSYKAIIAVCCQHHMKRINTLSRKTSKFLILNFVTQRASNER
jgi:hypothetical protein